MADTRDAKWVDRRTVPLVYISVKTRLNMMRYMMCDGKARGLTEWLDVLGPRNKAGMRRSALSDFCCVKSTLDFELRTTNHEHRTSRLRVVGY